MIATSRNIDGKASTSLSALRKNHQQQASSVRVDQHAALHDDGEDGGQRRRGAGVDPQQQQERRRIRQLLVRFQDRTYVYNNNVSGGGGGVGEETTTLLRWVSSFTRYPVELLRVGGGCCGSTSAASSNSGPPASLPTFVDVRVVSSIRGGKGGFGTLLRGSYRKQKASVVDYGDCRTLSGQRLRHVVPPPSSSSSGRDGGSGETTAASLMRLPTPHSALPAWAPLNAGRLASQHLRRLERARKLARRQIEARKREKELALERRADQVASYVNKATAAAAKIEFNTQDALREGMMRVQQQKEDAQKRKMEVANEEEEEEEEEDEASDEGKGKKRRLEPPGRDGEEGDSKEPEQPSSPIVCLSGDLGIHQQQQQQCQSNNEDDDGKKRNKKKTGQEQQRRPVVQLMGASNFGTAGIPLTERGDGGDDNNGGGLYYEVVVVTGGLVQVGWAASEGFEPSSDEGTGVGDCGRSWAVDLSRKLKLHDGAESGYGTAEWKAGDVVGCLLRRHRPEEGKKSPPPPPYEISFTLNGDDMGPAFDIDEESARNGLCPAISCNPEEIVELHLHEDDMKYFPSKNREENDGNNARLVPVGRYLLGTSDDADDGAITVEAKQKSNGKSPQSLSAIAAGGEGEKSASSGGGDVVGAGNKASAEETSEAPTPAPTVAEEPSSPVDLSKFDSAEQLEALGMDRLKASLAALGCKCGGTLKERASRLFSLKGIDDPSQIPEKLRAKKKQQKPNRNVSHAGTVAEEVVVSERGETITGLNSTSTTSVFDWIYAQPQLSSFASALSASATGVDFALAEQGPGQLYTIFVVNNHAFNALDDDYITDLLHDYTLHLQSLLLNHGS